MKNIQIPEYLRGVVNNSRDAFCDMLEDPSLWSDHLVKQTLKRTGSQAFDINDVQVIIKNYLTILQDTIRQGKSLD